MDAEVLHVRLWTEAVVEMTIAGATYHQLIRASIIYIYIYDHVWRLCDDKREITLCNNEFRLQMTSANVPCCNFYRNSGCRWGDSLTPVGKGASRPDSEELSACMENTSALLVLVSCMSICWIWLVRKMTLPNKNLDLLNRVGFQISPPSLNNFVASPLASSTSLLSASSQSPTLLPLTFPLLSHLVKFKLLP